MTTLFALQLVLPLIFVAWIALAPPRSLLGFWIQFLATATGLLTIGLTGLWLLPPWWAPYAFGAMLLLAMVIGLRRRRPFNSTRPSGISGWAGAVLFAAFGGVALYLAVPAIEGRNPPAAKLLDLAFPMDKGTYLVVNGGYDISINAHMKTLDLSVPQFKAWRGQSYGVDIVKINAAGLRSSGILPPEPGAYVIYGTRVLAPCSGDVVSSVDGLPDMQIPLTDRAHMAGNHVILRCGDAHVLLGHLQPESLKVRAGMRVAVGDTIGTAGNSGNTDEPHLHIHAQLPATANEPMSSDPLPISFGGRVLVRNDRVVIP
jgi:Peptidase family M23